MDEQSYSSFEDESENGSTQSRDFSYRSQSSTCSTNYAASANHSFQSTRMKQNKLKYSRSPFRVDLVAENERIDEINKVKIKDKTRKEKELQRWKERAKTAIIQKALDEANELEDLRKEKRKILEEEKRLKALLDLEKTNATRKEDRIIAERAERKRRYDKKAARRALAMQQLEKEKDASIQMLKLKHGVKDHPETAFQ